MIGVWGILESRELARKLRSEKEQMHSFLKALKAGVVPNNEANLLNAINDEMARLQPPKE